MTNHISQSNPLGHLLCLVVLALGLPASASMNFGCYTAADGIERMKTACCAAGTRHCTSVDRNLHDGSGCAKRNNDGGWQADPAFEDFIIVKGHDTPQPPPPAKVCVNWEDAGRDGPY